MLFTGVRDKSVDIWDYKTKTHLATLQAPGCREFSDIYQVQFSTDGRLLAVPLRLGKGVVVWNISDMNACKELYEVLHSRGSGNRFCFTRDCCQLVVASDCDLCLYDALSGIL
jgi:WD40 repeat protein